MMIKTKLTMPGIGIQTISHIQEAISQPPLPHDLNHLIIDRDKTTIILIIAMTMQTRIEKENCLRM